MASILPLKYVLDPRVDVSTFSQKTWMSPIGSQSILENSIVSNQAANNNNVQFDLKMVNDEFTVVDPSSIILDMPVTVVKTGSSSANLFQSDREGFRANALLKVMKLLTMSIKGNNVAQYAPYQFVHAQECFDEVRQRNDVDFNLSMIDNCQQLSDVYNTNSSPYAKQNDNPSETTRRSQPISVVLSTTANTATIQGTLHVNLGSFPPLSHAQDMYGFSPDPFQISIDWNSNLSYLWEVDLTNHTQPAATISVSFGQGSLHYRTMTLPLNQRVPLGLTVLPWHQTVATSIATSGSITAGSSFILGSNFQELTSVPQKVILFARQSQSSLNTSLGAAGSADYFAQINNVSIQWGNKDSYFSSCTQQQLFDITRHNGLVNKLDFASWLGVSGSSGTGDTGRKGSIFCADFIKDMGSPDFIAASGCMQKSNFKCTVTFTNVNASTQVFDFWMVLIYDGIIAVQDRTVAQSMNNVGATVEQILSGQQLHMSDIRYLEGGSVKSFFKNLWGKIRPVLGNVNDFLKKTKIVSKALGAIPYTSSIAPAVSALGYGEGDGIYAGEDGGYDGGEEGGEEGGDDGGYLAYGEGARLKKKVYRKRVSRRY